MRLAIYTSNRGTRMRKAIESGTPEFVKDIKLFFTEDYDTEYLKDWLENQGIKYVLCPYINGADGRERFSKDMLKILQEYKIDYVYCNGKHLLCGELLQVYKNRIINFHGALLPNWGGKRMLDKMIAANEFLLGTTAMFIDEGCDTGPIIMEAVVPLKAFQTAGYDAVLDTQVYMMHKIYDLLKENSIEVIDNVVNIVGADYTAFSVFPKVNG